MKPTFRLGGDTHIIVPEGEGLLIDGTYHAPPFKHAVVVEEDGDLLMKWGTEVVRLHAISPFEAAGGGTASQDDVRAPMPGTVISLKCAVGDDVQKGTEILVIESMKLQTSIKAPRDGLIAELPFAATQTFNKNDVLLRFEALEDEGA